MSLENIVYVVVAVVATLLLLVYVYRQKLETKFSKYSKAIDYVSTLAYNLVYEYEGQDMDNSAKQAAVVAELKKALALFNVTVSDDVLGGIVNAAVSAMHLAYVGVFNNPTLTASSVTKPVSNITSATAPVQESTAQQPASTSESATVSSK